MKEYDYYTVDEILEALESNVDAVLTKTTIIAMKLVNQYELRVEAEDVLHDALERILSDTRHVPKGIPLPSSIGQVIKSICYDKLELNREKIFKHSDDIDEHGDIFTTSSNEEDADFRWSLLIDAFKDDADAVKFLVATGNGLNKSELVSSVFGGDEKAYSTTRRRIVRNGQKYFREAG